MIKVLHNDGVTSRAQQVWCVQSRNAAPKEVCLQAAAEDRQ